MKKQWSPEFTQLTRATFGLMMDSECTHLKESDGAGLRAEGHLSDGRTNFYAGIEGESTNDPIDFELEDGSNVSFVRVGHLNLSDLTQGTRQHYLTTDGEVIGHYIDPDCNGRAFKLSDEMIQALLDEVSV